GAAPAPRNVILITIDTFRADKLSLYGGRHLYTPAIDSLARDGVVFDHAYTVVPLTAPSHSAMMTGRYPVSNGVKMNGSAVLDDSETTLAEILHDHGMRTGAIVSCLVLASRFNINQGFDFYYEEGISGSEGHHGLWFDERKAVYSIARAERWLESESDKPFFLWLHLFDPHHPYDPPAPFKQNYKDHPYDGEIVYTDRALGGFLRKLKEMGLYDDSIIMLLGDHGESLGDHLENFHGTFLYDATMHVPMIIKAPGGRRGVREEGMASTIDVMPTLVDAMGLAAPKGTEGISLMPAVMGSGSLPDRALYLESIYDNATFGWSSVRALRTAHYKYVDLPTPELYDLSDDPDELDNIDKQDPIEAKAMKEQYEKVRSGLEATARKDVNAAALDDAFRDRLLSLGYIAGSESKIVREDAKDPKDVVLLTDPVMYAQGQVKDGKYDEAAALLNRALQSDPANKIGLVTLGRALTGQKKLAEAEEVYRRALGFYPDNEEIYRQLGWLLIKQGRYGDAAELMSGLINVSPRSAQAHYLYGFALFYAKNWEKALQAFQESAKLSGVFSKTWYLMAICYEETGQRAEAIHALDEYLKRERDVESLFRDPYFVKLRETPEFREVIRKYL
ncbi:MAG TPA: sulfatase-like hydrolase/transferase, partial [Candidatus Saccharimonadales bacterium]|nr:sulfatase-like hydrolase/transferase [Candidatus Saccharimonadales bacterium]